MSWPHGRVSLAARRRAREYCALLKSELSRSPSMHSAKIEDVVAHRRPVPEARPGGYFPLIPRPDGRRPLSRCRYEGTVPGGRPADRASVGSGRGPRRRTAATRARSNSGSNFVSFLTERFTRPWMRLSRSGCWKRSRRWRFPRGELNHSGPWNHAGGGGCGRGRQILRLLRSASKRATVCRIIFLAQFPDALARKRPTTLNSNSW